MAALCCAEWRHSVVSSNPSRTPWVPLIVWAPIFLEIIMSQHRFQAEPPLHHPYTSGGRERFGFLRHIPLRERHGPFAHQLSPSLRHRNGHRLASTAIGDPDYVARRLDCGWGFESFRDYRDAGLIAIDGNNGNLAAAILSHE